MEILKAMTPCMKYERMQGHHDGGKREPCRQPKRSSGPHLSLGFGVLRMLSVSSISGPLSLGLYISRLS